MAEREFSRRSVLTTGVWVAGALATGGLTALLTRRATAEPMLWQIDPTRCINCGNCQTKCVLQPSAVRCAHLTPICGYCDICRGFLKADYDSQDSGAENELCPRNAIRRRLVAAPYYEYTIDEARCIGCGKCCKGCAAFGNASLMLQIRHSICVNCNQCAIAAACPARAVVRVPASCGSLMHRKAGGDDEVKK
jgi:electron transport complex protein RnfB